MAQLHQQFMNLPGPTDVLTFPLDEDEDGNVVAGEVVVCVPEARRRAREHGVAVERELLLYALHGMLHLCGYDDRTSRAFRTMHETEDRILTQLGVGPVFKPARAPRKAAPAAAGPRAGAARQGRKVSRATGAH
jgi:probable rRNA maturation factor